MLPLSPLGPQKLGPDTRQVHNVSSPSGGHSVYRPLWGVDSALVNSLETSLNAFLHLREGQTGKAQKLWKQAAHLAVVDRLRLNSHRLVAMYLDSEALSNVCWPVRLQGGITRDGQPFTGDEAQHVLALWLNSTPALPGLLALRQDTEGAWVRFKKTTLGLVPVLDLSQPDRSQLDQLLGPFSRLRAQTFPPIARAI